MKHLHIDIETYSELDLKKVGTYRYAQHPSTEILMISFALGGEKVRNIDLTARNCKTNEKLLSDFLALNNDPDNLKWAHNALFEKTLFKYASNSPLKGLIKPKEWRCTMVLGHYCSLLGALKHVGEVLRLPENLRKQGVGGKLIQKFCKPRKPSKLKPHTRATRDTDPHDWQDFRGYCDNDVEAEREVHRRLAKYDMPEHEWALYHLDQEINDRGLYIDRELVTKAIRLNDLEVTREKEQMLEKYEVNIASPVGLMDWLNARGAAVSNTQKGTLLDLKSSTDDSEIKEVIDARLNSSKAAIKKFHALERAATDDDLVCGCFQFMGASRTARWAGRIFQPQNIARGNLNPNEIVNAKSVIKSGDLELIKLCYGSANTVLPSLVRSSIIAPHGKKLVVADLASIESIMLGWACQSEYMLNLFRNGLDPYIDYATHLYGIPYDEVTKQQRTYAKPPTLGCGYMLGAKGLIAYAAGYGVELTEAEAKKQVNVYRNAYPDVVQFWHDIETAAKRCIINKTPQTVAYFTFFIDGPFMRVALPSGRNLSYLRPKIENRPAPWDKTQTIRNVVYEGLNQDTQKWERIATHAGKFTENLIQAIARDVLAEGLRNASAAEGIDVVGHVHDEIIALADIDDNGALPRLIQSMTTPAQWYADAPIKAEGFESQFYMKD